MNVNVNLFSFQIVQLVIKPKNEKKKKKKKKKKIVNLITIVIRIS